MATDANSQQTIARLYRMLFHYETEDCDFAPAYLTTMGQEDVKHEIHRIEVGEYGS
jgi:hypothetical protein